MTTEVPVQPSAPDEQQPAPSGMLVSYSPVAMAQRAGRFRSMLIRRTIGLVISVLFAVIYWFVFEPQPGEFLFWLLVASVAYSLVRVVMNFVQLKWARRTTARIPLGPAFQIDNHGIVVSSIPEGERVAWPQVTLVKGRNKFLNPGPRLEFRWDDGRVWSVALIVLDSAPSTMDSAFRAFSLGRFGLDLSSVDDVW